MDSAVTCGKCQRPEHRGSQECLLTCSGCDRTYHQSCTILVNEPRLLRGDSSYDYQCIKCSRREHFEHITLGRVEVTFIALINMVLAAATSDKAAFTSDEVAAFIGKHTRELRYQHKGPEGNVFRPAIARGLAELGRMGVATITKTQQGVKYGLKMKDVASLTLDMLDIDDEQSETAAATPSKRKAESDPVDTPLPKRPATSPDTPSRKARVSDAPPTRTMELVEAVHMVLKESERGLVPQEITAAINRHNIKVTTKFAVNRGHAPVSVVHPSALFCALRRNILGIASRGAHPRTYYIDEAKVGIPWETHAEAAGSDEEDEDTPRRPAKTPRRNREVEMLALDTQRRRTRSNSDDDDDDDNDDEEDEEDGDEDAADDDAESSGPEPRTTRSNTQAFVRKTRSSGDKRAGLKLRTPFDARARARARQRTATPGSLSKPTAAARAPDRSAARGSSSPAKTANGGGARKKEQMTNADVWSGLDPILLRLLEGPSPSELAASLGAAVEAGQGVAAGLRAPADWEHACVRILGRLDALEQSMHARFDQLEAEVRKSRPSA